MSLNFASDLNESINRDRSIASLLDCNPRVVD